MKTLVSGMNDRAALTGPAALRASTSSAGPSSPLRPTARKQVRFSLGEGGGGGEQVGDATGAAGAAGQGSSGEDGAGAPVVQQPGQQQPEQLPDSQQQASQEQPGGRPAQAAGAPSPSPSKQQQEAGSPKRLLLNVTAAGSPESHYSTRSKTGLFQQQSSQGKDVQQLLAAYKSFRRVQHAHEGQAGQAAAAGPPPAQSDAASSSTRPSAAGPWAQQLGSTSASPAAAPPLELPTSSAGSPSRPLAASSTFTSPSGSPISPARASTGQLIQQLGQYRRAMAERAGGTNVAGRLAQQLTSQLRLHSTPDSILKSSVSGSPSTASAVPEAAAGPGAAGGSSSSSSSSSSSCGSPKAAAHIGDSGNSSAGSLRRSEERGALLGPERASSLALPAGEQTGKGGAAAAGGRLLHMAGSSLSSNRLARSSLQAMLRQSLQGRQGAGEHS